MSRTIPIKVSDILSLVNCAESYGFNDDVLMSTFAEWCGYVSNTDIEQYATWFLSLQAAERGYTEEDYDCAIDQLTAWRDRYC